MADKEWSERDERYDEYVQIVFKVKEVLDARIPPIAPKTEPIRPEPIRHVELPKLLPKLLQTFDGDVLKWTGFWESFNNAVHSRRDLPDEEKFNYLRAHLRGEAERMVEGLSLTSASYAEAIDILKKEYGQTHIIIQARLLKLFKLQEGRHTTEIASLNSIYTEVNVHLRELRALGHPVESLGAFIVTLMLKRMPMELQTIWTRDNKRSPTDYEAIMSFVQNELIASDWRERLHAEEKNKPEPKQTTN